MRSFTLLSTASVLLFVACGYGDLCWQDRCGTYYEDQCAYDNCASCQSSPEGCPIYPDGGIDCGCSPEDPFNCRCPGEDYPYCETDEQCYPEEQCLDSWCQWIVPAWCAQGADCPEGQVCSAHNECLGVVEGCPLTDECLADPEGYTPEWMGIDPYYVGVASGSGFTVRVDLLVDFYADHLYGDAIAVVAMPEGWEEWVDLIVTGDRVGALLDGQVMERNVQPRRFDATFTAQLVTASRIVGTVTVAMDGASFDVPFELERVSPCGCEAQTCGEGMPCPEGMQCENGACVPACTMECCLPEGCPEGMQCENGVCVPLCTSECCLPEDCPEGMQCENGACVPLCTSECCLPEDCPSGRDCVEGTCRQPCASNCECAAGEACLDGYCTVI